MIIMINNNINNNNKKIITPPHALTRHKSNPAHTTFYDMVDLNRLVQYVECTLVYGDLTIRSGHLSDCLFFCYTHCTSTTYFPTQERTMVSPVK